MNSVVASIQGKGAVCRILSGLTALALLSGCDRLLREQVSGWTVYENDRYEFEFPRPNNWTVSLLPSNQDGRAFIHPEDEAVEIRGWASQIRLPAEPQPIPTPIPAPGVNFTTEQGLAAKLNVEIGRETSAMTLTLTLGGIVYNWEGRSPSDQFAEYYPLFNYIASQYRVDVETNAELSAELK
jgi:hypothetical protein